MIRIITDKLLALPIFGISPHMHMLPAFRDRAKATNNDIKFFKKDRSMELEPFFVMPPVYTNYASFRKAVGAAAEGCLAANRDPESTILKHLHESISQAVQHCAGLRLVTMEKHTTWRTFTRRR
jgi:hypothetical protein